MLKLVLCVLESIYASFNLQTSGKNLDILLENLHLCTVNVNLQIYFLVT